MNRFIILTSFLLVGLSSQAQNWAPFPLGQKSFYEYGDQSINIYNLDSLNDFGSYQVLHFDYTAPYTNGCYEAANHSPNLYPSYYIDITRPDSIILKGDSTQMFFSDGYPSSFTDSILFLLNIEKDSSWFSSYYNQLFAVDSLKFTCDSIYLDTIIGNTVDSIKQISIQAFLNSSPISSNFDTLKLLLSKNYGFKQFVSFYSGNTNVPLLGLDSGITKEGFNLPQLQDYFHLSAGDAIIWKEYFYSWNPMTPSYTLYFKDSITNVISTPDSVIYTTMRFYSGPGSIAPPGTQNHYKNKTKALTLSTSKWIDHSTIAFWGSGFSPNDLYRSSSITYTNDSIVNRSFSWDGSYYDSSNCNVYQITDLWNGVHYNTKYGLTSYYRGFNDDNWEWNIVGSKINGVIEGSYWQVGIEEFDHQPTFSIYPNPSNQNYVTVKGEEIKLIELLNLQGQTMLNTNESIINTSGLAKGIYLVRVTFENQQVATQKLILTR